MNAEELRRCRRALDSLAAEYMRETGGFLCQTTVLALFEWSGCRLEDMEAWEAECKAVYGHVLTGRHAHFCPDWDYLPLDETCADEYASCLCEKKAIRALVDR